MLVDSEVDTDADYSQLSDFELSSDDEVYRVELTRANGVVEEFAGKDQRLVKRTFTDGRCVQFVALEGEGADAPLKEPGLCAIQAEFRSGV